MFRLYYFIEQNVPSIVFSNCDLKPCLDYIKQHNYVPLRCMIISPNNRKITFSHSNDLIFDGNY